MLNYNSFYHDYYFVFACGMVSGLFPLKVFLPKTHKVIPPTSAWKVVEHTHAVGNIHRQWSGDAKVDYPTERTSRPETST